MAVIVPGQRLRQRGHRPVGLEIDVEARRGEGVQQLVKGGDRLDAADASGPDLTPRQLSDRARGVRHAIQQVVVEGDEHAVGRHVDVGLEMAVAHLDCRAERRQRVLGGLAGGPATPVRQGAEAGRKVGEVAGAHGHRLGARRRGGQNASS